MNVDQEGSNTQMMRQANMRKKGGHLADPTRHDDSDLLGTGMVDLRQSSCLNSNAEPKWAQLNQVMQPNTEDLALISDADEQLIFKIVFKEKVNLSEILIRADKAPESADDECSAPKLVKVFSNKDDLDFGDVGDETPASIIEMVVGEHRTRLVGARYQRVSSVQIFVEANQGDTPLTFLNRLSVIGHRAWNG
mmetsp:Transcript_131102/g.298462  ORF Transcript_131102/g.298462 Transcript_131102/m.298462 type:complete len:193 (+) Transcript_131102:480-1058(+)